MLSAEIKTLSLYLWLLKNEFHIVTCHKILLLFEIFFKHLKIIKVFPQKLNSQKM